MSTVRFDIVDTRGRITLTSPPYNFVGAHATSALKAGLSPKVVSERIGHTTWGSFSRHTPTSLKRRPGRR